jgi:hypothetical protein
MEHVGRHALAHVQEGPRKRHLHLLLLLDHLRRANRIAVLVAELSSTQTASSDGKIQPHHRKTTHIRATFA